MRLFHRALISLSVISLLVAPSFAQPITTESLIDQMIDMHRLTYFPQPAYKTVQFSSYDRRSTLPNGPHWFSNSDGFGREPIPNFEAVIKKPVGKDPGQYLICDLDGPGAIVRTWTAAMGGTIRLYLDKNQKPVWEGPAVEFLKRTYTPYANDAGLDEALLHETFYQRDAAYCPIPFAKHCRITWTGNHRRVHFYQIQIRTYESDAKVITFQPSDLKSTAKTIRRVARVLADPDKAWPYKSNKTPVLIEATVPARQRSQQILELNGPQAIERLTLTVSAGNMDQALRQTVMSIIFDDYPAGQVQAPIGDFFGAAPGINPYVSLPFTVKSDETMITRYVMPFARSCKIVIDNYGLQTVKITGSVLPLDYKWDKNRSMHFRARWRIDHDLVGAGSAVQDMPYLVARGTGLYVGSATMLMNPCNVPSSNGNWWGEGDEKIFVDNDIRPSTFGTGSEDYYNYSWSIPHHFHHPYCGQPRNDGPGNRGFVTNFRWHVIDPLPFKDYIGFYMELYTHTETPNMSYARIGYHYGKPGITDDHLTITSEDVRYLELPEGWQPVPLRGSQNSAFFQAEKLIEDKSRITTQKGKLFSDNGLMTWKPKQKSDKLDMKLEVKKDRKYIIHLTAALMPDSGPISVLLNGKPLGFRGRRAAADGIHLFAPYHTLLRNYQAKPLRLTKGDHTLTIQYDGEVGPDQDKSVGIDFVWLQKR
ncbi:MAG: glycoside hydrolase family 172 protein [Planctomycetota bacterium]|jgi:hypothetical protein